MWTFFKNDPTRMDYGNLGTEKKFDLEILLNICHTICKVNRKYVYTTCYYAKYAIIVRFRYFSY